VLDFLAVSDDELGFFVKPGEKVSCNKCGGAHELQAGTGSDGQPSTVLLFYSCGESSFLGAVGGRLLPGVLLASEEGEEVVTS
jgi:hypothetical protein